MKKLILALLTALLTVAFAVPAFAEEDGEQILEECLTEAYENGIDIEDEDFQNKLVEIIETEDDAGIKKICPNTFAKYPD